MITSLHLKKTLFRAFFACEIVVMFAFYFFGSHGLSALKRLGKEKEQIQEQVDCCLGEINVLQKEINEWKTSDFNREKIAREQLHMARPDELVIYLN